MLSQVIVVVVNVVVVVVVTRLATMVRTYVSCSAFKRQFQSHDDRDVIISQVMTSQHWRQTPVFDE